MARILSRLEDTVPDILEILGTKKFTAAWSSKRCMPFLVSG